ncbi:MAG: DUF2848 domain-containing protein [Paracoccaceae bacterium]|nr:DUF2848 domain-containing protein [Paracoccaceae bacterium]
MTGTSLRFERVSFSGTGQLDARIDHLVIAGWTGRDREMVVRHILELEELGVRRPEKTPMFYEVSNHLLTQAESLQLMGDASSGEAEIVLLDLPEGRFVGVGSDHTDRKIETHGIALAKQVCPKPVARTVWPCDEVIGHWDDLIVRSYAWRGDMRRLYQFGRAGQLLRPDDLLAQLAVDCRHLKGGTAVFLGTFAAIGGIEPADRFEFELEDPVLGRRIRGSNDFMTLAVAG